MNSLSRSSRTAAVQSKPAEHLRHGNTEQVPLRRVETALAATGPSVDRPRVADRPASDGEGSDEGLSGPLKRWPAPGDPESQQARDSSDETTQEEEEEEDQPSGNNNRPPRLMQRRTASSSLRRTPTDEDSSSLVPNSDVDDSFAGRTIAMRGTVI